MTIDLSLPDAAATEALGASLARGVAPGRLLYLRGDLGAGKTTLVRGLLHALGHAGKVKSPTYTLVEPYSISSLDFYHFDLYRLKNKHEWSGAGFQEYFNAQSFCVVEWPEKAGDLLPVPDLDIELTFSQSGRQARLRAATDAGRAWLSSLRSPSS